MVRKLGCSVTALGPSLTSNRGCLMQVVVGFRERHQAEHEGEVAGRSSSGTLSAPAVRSASPSSESNGRATIEVRSGHRSDAFRAKCDGLNFRRAHSCAIAMNS